jgi:tetratricopeptide (TPR) repeat protein
VEFFITKKDFTKRMSDHNDRKIASLSSKIASNLSETSVMLSNTTLSTVDVINNRAVAKLQIGNYMEARKYLVSALDILKAHQNNPPQQKEAIVLSAATNNSNCCTTAPSTTQKTTAAIAAAAVRFATMTSTVSEVNTTALIGKGIISVPIVRDTRHFESTPNDDDESNTGSLVDYEEYCAEHLSRCEYYNAAFVVKSSGQTIMTATEIIPEYNDMLAVVMYNVALTYLKEGINGRSASYRKAIYLYRRVTCLVKRGNVSEADEEKQQLLLLVMLASFHNLGYIYKELGQPSLYRNILEAGIVIERKLHLMNTNATSTIRKMQQHDRQFFAMNRFFSRYSEHSCAQAA